MSRKLYVSLDFKFKNPYTGKMEDYEYYLDSDDINRMMELYGQAYMVNLDGKANDVFNMFMNLDVEENEYLCPILDRMIENGFVKEQLSEELLQKANEAYLEEVESYRDPDEEA